MKLIRRLALAVVLLGALTTAPRAAAQELRASISGLITDPSGSAVPRAKVVATNVDTNVSSETESNDVGRYTILFLQPGRYTLSVEASGFRKFVRENVILGTSDRAGIDVAMEVGQVAESVTVTAESVLLETETASRGALVTNRQIVDLPNYGRNIYQLVWSGPGVIKASTYWGSMENYALGNSTNAILNGGIQRENETVMDGVTNTQPNRDVLFMPPLESIGEMKVQTSNYDASYGRFGGGVIAITTKSGTNAFHGSVYEFAAPGTIGANPWEANFLGFGKSRFVNNTFGFQVDGPILVPKLFDGRNRLFFMVSYEGLRERSSGGDSASFGDQAMRSGDFSRLPVTIYDPLTTRAEGNRFVRTPFEGNRIPAFRINNVATKLLEFVPLPNLPGRAFGLENYAKQGGAANGYDEFLSKLDYRINDRNNVYFSYGRLPYTEIDDILIDINSPAEPSTENPLVRNFYRWAFDWTSTLDTRTVLNFRWGLARYVNTSGNPAAVGFNPRQLGFADALVSQFSFLHFPQFAIGGFYTTVGAGSVKNKSVRDSYSYQLNLNRHQGRHQLKYGAEFRIYNENNITPGLASGVYNFSKSFTQANPAQADRASGDEFASFLLGYPSGGRVDLNIDPAYQGQYYSLFVHDDFKVHPRVTLNLGLRWDYERPYAERYDRMVRGFAFDEPSPIANRVPGLNLRGGLLYTGSSGENRLAFDPDKNNIQPRIGVAVKLTSKWVVRGGYGLYYLGASGAQPSTGFSQSTPLIASLDGNIPRASLTNAFPEGLIRPRGSADGLATLLGQGVSFSYLDRVIPYSHQYSFGLERTLGRTMLIEASYSGNETRRYPVGVDLNVLPANQLGRDLTYYRQRVNNPMAGLLPLNAAKNGAQINQEDLLLPYPHYTGVSMSNVPIGKNHYHSAQFRFVKRYSHNMTLNANYTISKILEERNFLNNQDFNFNDIDSSRLERRLAEFDAPQKLSVIWTYELPFGAGKRFGAGARGAWNKMISGWQINTNGTLQSGFPVPFPNAPNLAARSAELPASQRNVFNAFDKSLFLATPPTAPNLTYNLRTFPTRFPDVRFFPLKVMDLSPAKKTMITERVGFEFRAEFLNAFNHPWFDEIHNNGGANVTQPNFGFYRFRSRAQQRRITLVGKITW